MRLSICIPTHQGRAALLAETLASIADQIGALEQVEICVSDNASHDETETVIAGVREQIGERMVYRRSEVDRGFTTNLLGAVAAARGDYVWLLGSDDKIAPGGIAAALALLDRHPGATGFCIARRHFAPEPPFAESPDHARYLPPRHEEEQVFRGAQDAQLAFGHLQGYISTQILRREAWERAIARTSAEDFERARNYPHLQLIGLMALEGGDWVWHPGELVLHRATTQFLEGQTVEGHAWFQTIDLTDRKAIWRHLHGEGSPIFRGLMRAAWRDHGSPLPIAVYKASPEHVLSHDLQLLRTFPRLFGRVRPFWLQSLPLLLLPHPLFKFARAGLLRVRAARG